MKLIPLILLFAAAYLCGGMRDGSRNSSAVNHENDQETVANNTPPGTIAGGFLNPKAISLPQPSFPEAAKREHASGLVIVEVIVDESGKVISANAVNGDYVLRPAAVEAALRAKFDPRIVDGQPKKVSGTLGYTFQPHTSIFSNERNGNDRDSEK